MLLLCLKRLLSLAPIRTEEGNQEESRVQKLTLGIENLLKRLDRSQVYRPSNAAPDKPKQAASGKKERRFRSKR